MFFFSAQINNQRRNLALLEKKRTKEKVVAAAKAADSLPIDASTVADDDGAEAKSVDAGSPAVLPKKDAILNDSSSEEEEETTNLLSAKAGVDDVEMLLDMMVGIQRDPEAVAWRLRTLACCVCLIYMVLQQNWDLPTAASKQPKSQ